MAKLSVKPSLYAYQAHTLTTIQIQISKFYCHNSQNRLLFFKSIVLPSTNQLPNLNIFFKIILLKIALYGVNSTTEAYVNLGGISLI